jgi:ZIP family zinc transporter
MSEWLWALALASMPALGNFSGGVLAELMPVSQRVLSLALHLAAGIVLAVVVGFALFALLSSYLG